MSKECALDADDGASGSISQRIAERYSRLSAGHRRLADYVLANPHEAALMTLERLAQVTGVSQATASRFGAKLGLAGHPELKRLLHAELKDALRPVEDLVDTIGFGGLSPTAPWTRSMQDDVSRIREIEAVGGDSTFAASSALLAQARHVYVIGFGSSAFIAQYAAYYLASLRPGCEALTDASGMEGLARRLLDAGTGDAAVIIGFARYSTESIRAAEHLDALKLPTICITDSRSSPVARFATKCFVVGKKPGYVLTGAGAGALVLVEALLRGTAAVLGREAIERRSARLVSLLGDAVVPPRNE